MMYEEFVSDFAKRTKANYELVKSLAAGEKERDSHSTVFEVTQLVNSLLGLLVFPQQEFYNKLPEDYPNKELEALLSKCTTTYEERVGSQKSFANVLRHIRNAIAHKKLEAYPYGPQEIKGFIFRDGRSESHPEFELKLSVEELEQLLYLLFDYMIIDNRQA